MTLTAKHRFQSAKGDSGDTTIVRPSNWNDTHELLMATAKLLGRRTVGAGAVEEIDFGSVGEDFVALDSDVAAAALLRTLLGSIVTADIANGAVTLAKIVDATAANVILGRKTTGSGDFEEITLGDGISIVSGALVSPQPVAGGFKGLVIQNNATNPNTQIDIDAEAVTVETSGGQAYRLRSVDLTINTGAANGANAMDSGGLTNNAWFYSFVIYNPTTNTVAGLLSTSATAPTLPSGYTAYARFGTHRTNGSAQLKRTIQRGRTVQYIVGTNPSVVPLIAQGVAGTYDTTSPVLTAVSVTGVVPPTASRIHVSLANGNGLGSGGPAAGIVAPNTAWGGSGNGPAGANGNSFPLWVVNATNAGASAWFTLEAAQTLGWAASGTNVVLTCPGYEDNL